MNLLEESGGTISKKSGTIVLPSFVEFLQSIMAKQKIELEKIEAMDIKAVANGNGGSGG